ncbi:MAG: DNA/RNA non-specific endonuclease [Paludibacteraceae bacterium]|nr:DNA/RNA non-specific endonuclease [Paludibacteraceae bacterium]
MRKTTLALFMLFAVCAFARQKSLLHCDVPKGVSSQILVREGYVTSYNKDTRLPNWVAWRLTKERMESPVPGIDRKMFDFHRVTRWRIRSKNTTTIISRLVTNVDTCALMLTVNGV